MECPFATIMLAPNNKKCETDETTFQKVKQAVEE
jgi:hypothetical protein